ncbi:MAG TPA: nucleotidyltransferase family protein [Ideonella sp.]|nr:nucleotidyltransferase family protein [Ideonella sp.]
MPEPDAAPPPAASLIGQLLAHAATGAPLGDAERYFTWQPEGGDLRQFRWALEGGLGPLLHHATRGHPALLPPDWRGTLLAADLSTRVRHGNSIATTLEIVDACARLGVALTLLKGISVSEQWYPEEHLRPMGDVDVLIPAADYARVEAALLAEGYEQVDEPAIPGLQHGIPLRRLRCDTLVELHTTLFAADSALSLGQLFSAAGVSGRTVPSLYHGRPVQRLGAELQLAYIASSWFNDLTQRKVHPSFLASLFDAVYLLRSAGRTLDWRDLPQWLDNEMAAASLYTMATYLPRHGVAPLAPDCIAQLAAAAQPLVGPVQLKLIHGMLDSYLIAGRPWRFVLPPPVPGRYSLPHQFRKRVLSHLHRPSR